MAYDAKIAEAAAYAAHVANEVLRFCAGADHSLELFLGSDVGFDYCLVCMTVIEVLLQVNQKFPLLWTHLQIMLCRPFQQNSLMQTINIRFFHTTINFRVV